MWDRSNSLNTTPSAGCASHWRQDDDDKPQPQSKPFDKAPYNVDESCNNWPHWSDLSQLDRSNTKEQELGPHSKN